MQTGARLGRCGAAWNEAELHHQIWRACSYWRWAQATGSFWQGAAAGTNADKHKTPLTAAAYTTLNREAYPGARGFLTMQNRSTDTRLRGLTLLRLLAVGDVAGAPSSAGTSGTVSAGALVSASASGPLTAARCTLAGGDVATGELVS